MPYAIELEEIRPERPEQGKEARQQDAADRDRQRVPDPARDIRRVVLHPVGVEPATEKKKARKAKIANQTTTTLSVKGMRALGSENRSQAPPSGAPRVARRCSCSSNRSGLTPCRVTAAWSGRSRWYHSVENSVSVPSSCISPTI